MMFQCWFLSPEGMVEIIFCGWRYELRAEGIEARCNLYDYVRFRK